MGEFNKKYNSGERRSFGPKNFDRKPRFDNRNSEHESKNEKEDFIFGLRPVMEAIEAGKTIDKIFVQGGLQGEIYADLKKLLKKYNIRPNTVPVEKLNRFTRKNHQGVVAFISEIPFYKIEDLLPQIFEEGKVPFLLILDRLTDVRNFGAIARTAECVGIDAIVIPDKGAAPLSGITIASIPTHSAVLAIAPKFLTSVKRSKINKNGTFPSSKICGNKSSIL